MPNLRQHTDPSGTFGTLGLGTNQSIKINADNSVEIPNLPAKLNTANAFGVGQTWQQFNYPTQRAIVTTYYNTTGKPIVISVRYRTGAFANSGLTALIDSIVHVLGSCGNTVDGGITFIVPSGSSYSVINNSGSIASLYSWSELR